MRSTSAAVSFTLNGQGARTTAYLSYGRTRTMQNSTSSRMLTRSNAGAWTLTWTFTSLAPHTTYYFQAVALNSGGAVRDTQRSVKTRR